MKYSYIKNLIPLHKEEPVRYNRPDPNDRKLSEYSDMSIKAQYWSLAEEEQLNPEKRTPHTEVKLRINQSYRKGSDTSNEYVTTEKLSKYLNLSMTNQYLPFAEEQLFKTESGTYFTKNAANCTFEETFEENLRYIKSYKLDEALPYMEKLQLYSDPVPNNLSQIELQGTCI